MPWKVSGLGIATTYTEGGDDSKVCGFNDEHRQQLSSSERDARYDDGEVTHLLIWQVFSYRFFLHSDFYHSDQLIFPFQVDHFIHY